MLSCSENGTLGSSLLPRLSFFSKIRGTSTCFPAPGAPAGDAASSSNGTPGSTAIAGQKEQKDLIDLEDEESDSESSDEYDDSDSSDESVAVSDASTVLRATAELDEALKKAAALGLTDVEGVNEQFGDLMGMEGALGEGIHPFWRLKKGVLGTGRAGEEEDQAACEEWVEKRMARGGYVLRRAFDGLEERDPEMRCVLKAEEKKREGFPSRAAARAASAAARAAGGRKTKKKKKKRDKKSFSPGRAGDRGGAGGAGGPHGACIEAVDLAFAGRQTLTEIGSIAVVKDRVEGSGIDPRLPVLSTTDSGKQAAGLRFLETISSAEEDSSEDDFPDDSHESDLDFDGDESADMSEDEEDEEDHEDVDMEHGAEHVAGNAAEHVVHGAAEHQDNSEKVIFSDSNAESDEDDHGRGVSSDLFDDASDDASDEEEEQMEEEDEQAFAEAVVDILEKGEAMDDHDDDSEQEKHRGDNLGEHRIEQEGVLAVVEVHSSDDSSSARSCLEEVLAEGIVSDDFQIADSLEAEIEEATYEVMSEKMELPEMAALAEIEPEQAVRDGDTVHDELNEVLATMEEQMAKHEEIELEGSGVGAGKIDLLSSLVWVWVLVVSVVPTWFRS